MTRFDLGPGLDFVSFAYNLQQLAGNVGTFAESPAMRELGQQLAKIGAAHGAWLASPEVQNALARFAAFAKEAADHPTTVTIPKEAANHPTTVTIPLSYFERD